MRMKRLFLLFAVLLAVTSIVRGAEAGPPLDACIPPALTEALSDCSGVTAFPARSYADLVRDATSSARLVKATLRSKKASTPIVPREFNDRGIALEGAIRRFL